MAICVFATWVLISTPRRAASSMPSATIPRGRGAIGINVAAMHFIAFGWLGLMAGIAGLMQVHFAKEVVPTR